MKKYQQIYILFLILSYISITYGLSRPLNKETLKIQNSKNVAKFEISQNPDITHSITQINSQGDTVMAVFNHDPLILSTTIAFMNFDGKIENKYNIQMADSTKEKLGFQGLLLLPSGENDSVIIIFSAQNTSGEALSIYMGILGKDGNWKRGQPIAIFHDQIFDGNTLQDNINYKFNLISGAKSGNIIQIIAKTEIGTNKDQAIVYNFIDISGTENLVVQNNQGTVISKDNIGSYQFSNKIINTCLAINNTGDILCTVNTNNVQDNSLQIILLEFSQGSYVDNHIINYNFEGLLINEQFLINSIIMRKIPETNEIILALTEGQNNQYLNIISLNLDNLDNEIQNQTLQPLPGTMNQQTQLYQVSIEIVSQSQGYLILTEDTQKRYPRTTANLFNGYIQEFNPTNLQSVVFPYKQNIL